MAVESASSCLIRLKKLCPCRDLEVDQLHAALDNLPRPSSLLIYGQHQTCKTKLLKHYFEEMRKSGSPHLQQVSWMDTRQCITQRSFYERVLDSVQQRDVELRKGSIESTSLVVDNLDSFSRYLARALESDKQEDRILVFDHYSFTQFDNSEAIMTVIKEVLQSLDGHAIAIFVVSHYSDIPRTFVMPTIQFRLYSSSDIFMLMQQDCERAYEGVDCVAEAQWPLVWERYCNTIYGTFVELVGHDLQLYRILAKKLLHAYLEPVRQHRLEATNHVQLARAAQAVMAKEAWVLDEEQIPVATPQISSGASQLRRAAQETELSISMRYLLIAAFLASYNPVKTDVMFFSKGHGLAKKRRAASSKHAKAEQLPQRILGPKGFPIERMVAIYQAILPSTLLYDITIDQQIASLASLKLISRVGGASADLLDDGKWLVNVSFDAMHKLAQSVKFELARFMEV